MTDHAAREAGAFPDVHDLADSLRSVAAAFDQARASGLGVCVPEPLYAACLEIVNRHGLPGGTPPGGGRPSRDAGRAAAPRRASRNRQVDMDDVPLRRLVWQVVNPGEEFTVADVCSRLAELGAPRPATAVSNALGYWVSCDRLARVRKGTYSYPRPTGAPSATQDDRRQEGPAARPSQALKAPGEENSDVPISRTRRQAAS